MFEEDDKWIEIRCDSLRHEPKFDIITCNSINEKNKRIVELVKKLPHPIIVYTTKPDDANKIKKLLNDEGLNNVKTFTGKTNSTERKILIDEWIENNYEIMVATSAFGVGVDKDDVRTVLHTYIPENPNEYYQELGRGGRDGISCLSVMCIEAFVDKSQATNKLSKKVMTTEVIIERWFTMFNSSSSRIDRDKAYIDTSVKPDRLIEDPLDDLPISDVSLNWNIYVLLFLRRHSLLSIEEIVTKGDMKYFRIKNINSILLRNTNLLTEQIELYRTSEADYYSRNFKIMTEAIKFFNKECWSEMFFSTYGYADEYCPGCGIHKKRFSNENDEIIKKIVMSPKLDITLNQENLFNGCNELVIFDEFDKELLSRLLKINIKTVVDFSNLINVEMFENETKNVFILNEFSCKNIGKRNEFFISGVIAVIYSKDERKTANEFIFVKNNLLNDSTKIIHIFEKDFYNKYKMKYISEMINGPIMTREMIY